MLSDVASKLFENLRAVGVVLDLKFFEALLEIVLILIIASLLSLATSRVISKLYVSASKNNKKLLYIVGASLEAPIYALIWIYTSYCAIKIIPLSISQNLLDQFQNFNSYLIECLIGWFLIRMIDGGYDYIKEHKATKSKQIDKTLLSTVSKILKLIVFITIAIMIMDNLGVRVTGLLTFAGIGTAAIGFASKDIFANYLGALVIFIDKPFAVGDDIDLPEKHIEGVVEEINWRMTKIRTYEHGIIYVPNNYFYNRHIKNNSKIKNSRIKFNFYINSMDLDKVSKIIVAVRSVVFSHELVDEECEHSTVCFEGMASYAPSILVDCSTKLNEYSEVMALQQELMFLILKILKSHKVELVFSKS